MSRKCMIARQNKELKFPGRKRNRCSMCGRPRGYIRIVKLCRICFRKYANEGQIMGFVKASW